LEHDHRFAIAFFIPEEITAKSPVPDFHVDISADMMGIDDPYYCCAVPRDHAKTTLAKINAVRLLVFHEYRFLVYLSNTSEVAAGAVNDIIDYIKSDNFSYWHDGLCGASVKWVVEQTHHGYFEFTIFPGTEREKHIIIKALGAGKQVRGLNINNQRPDLAIVDDVETTEVLDTEIGYLKLKKWFYGTFLKAMDKYKHKVIQLGNMTAYRCLVRDHTESKFWRSVRYGCLLNNGTSLWPEAWPMDKLKLDFERYKEQGMLSIWFAEMMNMPIADGMGLIKDSELRYCPSIMPEQCEFAFITVDPAISTKSWGHRTGIAVHGWVEDKWVLVESFAEVGLDPLKLFDKVVSMAYRWGVSVVGIESVAYQASLKYFFQHLCLERHIEGMEFVDLVASARKAERLAVYASEIKAGNFWLTDSDVLVTQQLLMFDPRRKDNDCDLADAAAYAPQMIQRYMPLIMNTYKGQGMPENTYQSLVEFSEI
jgi:hypothetical protein